MFGNNEYIGLCLEGDLIRLARIRIENNQAKIVKLDQFSLVEEVHSSANVESMAGVSEEVGQTESVFGFQEEEEEKEDELDLSELNKKDSDLSMDMVDETREAQSNEVLLYTVLDDMGIDPIHVGVNVPAGSAIYQIIDDTNFKQVEEEDLVEDLESKLQSIYGSPPSKDNYAYEVREDGSLVLASIDGTSPTLDMVDEAKDFYSGKIQVEEVIADEVSLVGMVRANYDLDSSEVTCVIQCGKSVSRVVFMQGDEIWLVAPLINEGTESRSFLNTVFSKILFQLDTGEVPDLDRILLANNSLGSSAVKFFKDNFPDIRVENLSLDEELFETSSVERETIPAFTTAISTALAASGFATEHFPQLSFLPEYVKERQKIFKLQWHGMLLLFCIFLTPIVFNYFYNKNVNEIKTKTDQLEQVNSQITQITPIVESTNELKNNLSILREKLVLLDTLSRGTKEWSVKLNILNSGINRVNNSWITSMSESNEGTFLQGYTLSRNRIPRIVNIFEEATLLNVNVEEMREQDVFNFSILVKKFVGDESVYAPSSPKEVQNLIEN